MCGGVVVGLGHSPHVTVTGFGVKVTKEESQGVGNPDKPVGYTRGIGAGQDKRDRRVATGGEHNPTGGVPPMRHEKESCLACTLYAAEAGVENVLLKDLER